jgi:hypothetical protein
MRAELPGQELVVGAGTPLGGEHEVEDHDGRLGGVESGRVEVAVRVVLRGTEPVVQVDVGQELSAGTRLVGR